MKFACSVRFSAMADQLVWLPYLSHHWKWTRVTKCMHSLVVSRRLEGDLVIVGSRVSCNSVHYVMLGCCLRELCPACARERHVNLAASGRSSRVNSWILQSNDFRSCTVHNCARKETLLWIIWDVSGCLEFVSFRSQVNGRPQHMWQQSTQWPGAAAVLHTGPLTTTSPRRRSFIVGLLRHSPAVNPTDNINPLLPDLTPVTFTAGPPMFVFDDSSVLPSVPVTLRHWHLDIGKLAGRPLASAALLRISVTLYVCLSVAFFPACPLVLSLTSAETLNRLSIPCILLLV